MKYYIYILLFLCTVTASAQSPFIKQVWIAEPELPVNVYDIVYQPKGYIWLATDNGVYRYNGRIFTKLNDSIAQLCTAIAANENAVYAGYKNGVVSKLEGTRMVPVEFKNPRPKTAITSLKVLGEKTLLIATEEEGIYLYINGYLLAFNMEKGLADNYISDIAIDRKKILLATDNGVNILSIVNSKIDIRTVNTRTGLPDNIVTTIGCVAGKGLCWIGTQQGGISMFDDIRHKVIPIRSNVPWTFGQVNDILPVNKNEAWCVTDDGFLLELNIKDDLLSITPYSFNAKIKRVIRDKAGNIWCATNKGLIMHTGLYARHIPVPPDFHLNNYTAIACDKDNNLWLTQNRDLYKINISHHSVSEHITTLPAAITTLHTTSENGIWIGTFGKGLYQYSRQKQLRTSGISSLKDAHILSVTHTQNKLWVASFNGVDELETNANGVKAHSHYNKQNGIGSDYVYQLYSDKKDRIWMATDGGGVSMYDGTHFKKWDVVTQLKSDVFYSITSDNAGIIWAASLDKGLFKYDGKVWKGMNQKQGLQDINITALASNGRQGIVVINRNGIDQWYGGDYQFRHFNRRLGVDIDSNSKVLNCIANDTFGNVYVPYEHGIIQIKAAQSFSSIKPDIRIRKLSLFFKDLPTERHLFHNDENHISFNYEGISFSNPERLHYRYKLEGYDDSWVYTSDETVPFAQLNPGDYTFRIQASLSDNFMDAAEGSHHFSISKPFWQTPLFLTMALFLLVICIYLFVKWRERGLVKLNQLQKERLVYEYEHLKSQVNPHFLFNSFNTLVNIIEEDKDAAIDYTVHLSDLYRNMLSYKDIDLITLEAEYGIVKSYLHIQKSRFGDALMVYDDIDPALLETKKIVPLALQILLENAIKHNIVATSQPLHIHIVASETEIVVRNNLQEKITKEKGEGIGIENIRKRYELLTKRSISNGIVNNEYIVRLPLL